MRSIVLLMGLAACIDYDPKGVKPDDEGGIRDLEVSPGLVDFGTLSSGAPVTDVVTLTSVGDSPVTVSSIDVAGSSAYALTLPDTGGEALVLAPGESAEVVVTYTPASFDDQGQVVVSSDALEPEQIVRLVGAGLYPAIEVLPASLYFESEYGESVYDQVVVYSVGTADLDISEMIVQGVQFTVEGDIPVVLAPGETTTLDVTYTPEVEGESASGKIWLTTNTPLGYAVVPLEARQTPPCIGLGEAWDRGLLDAHTELDGLTFRIESSSADEEVCIDHWYVWISSSSQDLGAGDMDADFGGTYPEGSLTIGASDFIRFGAAEMSGNAWYCMEQFQYTQPSKSYDFTGARVPEPLLSYMLAGDQDGSWAWQEDHPVMIAGRRTNFLSMPGGNGSDSVTLRVLNMGTPAGTVEVRETIPADYTASGFSPEPDRSEAGADGATVYIWEVALDGREFVGSYEQMEYDQQEITYTLAVPPCRGRQYLEPMQTRWKDSDGVDRIDTANPLVINCEE